jgi:hypothetical protein
MVLSPLRALSPAMDTITRTTTDAVSAVHLAPSDPTPTATDGRLLRELTPEAATALLRLTGPGVDTPLAMVELRHLGGAAERPDPRGGVLDHLPGRFLGMAGNVAPDARAFDDVTTAATRLWNDLEPWRAERDYLNFREVPSPADTFFDDATRRRLTGIRQGYDPHGVVRPNHITWQT